MDLERLKQLSGLADNSMRTAGAMDEAARSAAQFVDFTEGLLLEVATLLEELDSMEDTPLPDSAREAIAEMQKKIEQVTDKINAEFH